MSKFLFASPRYRETDHNRITESSIRVQVIIFFTCALFLSGKKDFANTSKLSRSGRDTLVAGQCIGYSLYSAFGIIYLRQIFKTV